jgi:hypothetical protein
VKGTKKTNLQIRGIPSDLHDRVRREADRRGQTMSDYVIELIRNAPDERSIQQWLEEVRSWKPVPLKPGTDTAKAVREAREERADQLARGFEERWGKTRP